MWGTRMNPSLASAWTRSFMAAATVAGVPTNDWRPVTSTISSRIHQLWGAARSRHCRGGAPRPSPPLPGGGQRVAVHTDAGPTLGHGVLAEERVDVRQRAVGVVA